MRRKLRTKTCRGNPLGTVVDETNKLEVTSYPLQIGDQRKIKSLSSVKRVSSTLELV